MSVGSKFLYPENKKKSLNPTIFRVTPSSSKKVSNKTNKQIDQQYKMYFYLKYPVPINWHFAAYAQ